jgi:hypothetical protein
MIALVAGCSPSATTTTSVSHSPSASAAAATATPTRIAPRADPESAPTPTATPVPAPAWAEHDLSAYTTAGGADLAATVDGETTFVHVVASNLEEAWENGDDASVYLRTANEGRTWRKQLMLGGYSPRIATAGRRVYVAFAAYQCRSGIGVLRNRDHGRRGAWSDVTCLTREHGGLSSLAIAATGDLVYVASADEATGRVAVRISGDRGRIWKRVRLGVAHMNEDEVVGPVEVAASGSMAAVAWSDDGVVVARVSTDSGRHWRSLADVAAGSVHSASAHGSRVALAGFDSEGSPWIRAWTDAGDWRAIAIPDAGTRSMSDSWVAEVALGPGAGTALVTCAGGDAYWAISADGGATWEEPRRVRDCPDEMSVLWTADGRAFVIHSDGDEGYALAAGP